jgi:acetoacetate decarboxylase
MFEPEPGGRYMMPAHFGPCPQEPRQSGWYRDVTAASVSFLTDPVALAAHLPSPYKVAENAVVTVTYARNRDVDWLAGHGYNLVAVTAAAVFEGKNDRLKGNYTLVMWENLTDPILTGRELQGIPKLYADIPDHIEENGRWQVDVSHFGHQFLGISLDGFREPTAQEMAEHGQASENADHSLAWRFIPGVNGAAPSVNEAITYPSENVIREAWVASGELEWQHLGWEQNPTQYHIINALAALPMHAMLPAVVTRGSTNLVVPEHPTRILS